MFSFFRDEGFFCSLKVLYGGPEISKLQFLIKKKYLEIFICIFFFNFLVIKTLDPYPDPYSLEMLYPDLDPQQCLIKETFVCC